MPSNPYAELAELAGGFIHDIKNHLGTLGLNLQLLAEDFEGVESQRDRRVAERVARMQAECGRLVDLSNDFLRFARVKDLDLQETDLLAVIEEMLDFFGPMAKQHAVEIKVYVPAGLRVALDRNLFKQALLNLLLNAQQAMPDGGQLTIQAAPTDGDIALSLIDTGKGMPPDVLARVFQPFYSTRDGGTGLGLPTTKRIIEAHSGTIAVESAVGTGTRFTIHLPASTGGKQASPPTLCVLDGVRMPLADARVSVLDRAFVFGDAIYEVLRIYSGRPWLEDEHFARLERSLAEVRITGVDLARLRRQMHELIAAGPYREGIVYIQVSRGVAPRGHAFPANTRPTELMWVQETGDPYAEKRDKGVPVILQPDLRWKRCDVKSVNLLANVLANQAAKEAGAFEAILYTPDGTLTEATHSSFFAVKDDVFRTTPSSNAILPGITRGFMHRLIQSVGLTLEHRSLHRDELPGCTELFLTGTSLEVGPIISVDGIPIDGGKPGPVVRRLQVAFREAVAAFLASGPRQGPES
jgi:D-alanine transaminase